jgi:hypothetical protein
MLVLFNISHIPSIQMKISKKNNIPFYLVKNCSLPTNCLSIKSNFWVVAQNQKPKKR